MSKRNYFIKLFDERIVNALCAGGFSYTQEKMNGNQTVYCFENSKKLTRTIRKILKEWNYEAPVIIKDCTLHF